jgi:hypothetical protein
VTRASRTGPAAPRLLLSTRSLDGVTRVSRERLQEIQTRFREPESLAVTLVKALDAGADGVLGAPSPALRRALAELDRAIPLHAVLPALSPQDYRMLEPGVEPLLRRARREAGLAGGFRMGLTGLLRLAAFRRGDFAARVPMLLEADARWLPRRGVTGIVIASPLTDAALAGDHRAFFETLPRFVRSRFRASAGFETRNPGVLLQRLREWGLEPDLVLGPVNPRGLGMKPRPAEVVAELARCAAEGGPAFLATELRAGGICPLDEGAGFALEHGAHGLAPDLAEMDEVAVELRGLRGLLPD